MKSDIHPSYREVLFRDRSAGLTILTRSTVQTTKTAEHSDGRTYPVVDVDVSSASHPFWTGRKTTLDTAGRVEKFQRRYRDSFKR